MRGKDQSVSDPMPEEKLVATGTLKLDATIPLVKLSIPSTDGSLHYFVAPSPTTVPYTPLGRTTRGFQAYDVSQGVPVFLRDSWRIDLPDIHPEGSVYEMLNGAGIHNIPCCLVSGDVLTTQYHETKTLYYMKQPCACHSDAHFLPHRHYRLALDIIRRPLIVFDSSYQMVRAVRDALIGEITF